MAQYRNTSADALSGDHLYAYDYRGAQDRQVARRLRRRGEGLGTGPVGQEPEAGRMASLVASPEDSRETVTRRGRTYDRVHRPTPNYDEYHDAGDNLLVPREDRSAELAKAKGLAREDARKKDRWRDQLATDGKRQRLIDNGGYPPDSNVSTSGVKRMLNEYLQQSAAKPPKKPTDLRRKLR